MMISETLNEALQDQLNFELESAYLYFAMGAYMDSLSLTGFSHWMKMQAQEEVQHAVKIYNYLNDRGARVKMLPLPAPKNDYTNVLEVFEAALGHEKKLSSKLNVLADAALKERDNTTYSFLEWFLTEQVEEVSMITTICDKLRLIGDNGHGLLMLNNELGGRQPEAQP